MTSLEYQIRLKEHLSAPVRRGEQVGQIIYFLNDNKFFSCPDILATKNIQKNTFTHCAELVFKNFFHLTDLTSPVTGEVFAF